MIEYEKFARYYDLIHNEKDYKKEAKRVSQLISKYKRASGKRLLDVACGTGEHIKFLKKDYFVEGLEQSKYLIKIAKKKNSKIIFHEENMESFRLNKKFDVIVCLFNSINYINNEGDLKKVIKNFSNHLNKGGILIMESWHKKESFQKEIKVIRSYEDDDFGVKRKIETKLEGNDLLINAQYNFSKNKKLPAETKEQHKIRIFEKETFLENMRNSGFKTKYIKNYFGKKELFLGIKI